MKDEFCSVLQYFIRMQFVHDFEISLNNKFQFLYSMTKIILTGLTLATILFTIGISSQSFAMPMTDKTQNDVLQTTMTGNITSDGQEWILVAIPPTHKGESAIYQLVPKPVEGIDGIAISQPADPHEMILVGVSPTHKGDTPVYQWVPKPDPNPIDFTS